MCGPKPCSSQDCTWGEKHRMTCEAKMLLGKSKNSRQEYYQAIEKRRGRAAVQTLIEKVKSIWTSSK